MRLGDAYPRLGRHVGGPIAQLVPLRRLGIIRGIGSVTAAAFAAFAPVLDCGMSRRNVAAWLGLVPRSRSTGGKTWFGSVSRMGQTDTRRLLIVGAMSPVLREVRMGGRTNRWLAAMDARKPNVDLSRFGAAPLIA